MRQRLASFALVAGLSVCWTVFATAQTIVHAKDGWPPVSCSAEQAADGERYLQSHPTDDERASCLLSYYIQMWPRPDLHGDRIRLLRWVIENRPDLQPYDQRSLRIDPRDKEDYAEIRTLWLRQVARFPNSARVLANAADCLALTDRESAANWLRTALNLQPPNSDWIDRLARVYAAGIAGISGETPRGQITSVEPVDTESPFARLAMEEAGREATLAAMTGNALHSYSKKLLYAKLSTIDYDSRAEELMLKSAALDYPNPARTSVLRDFYRDRRVLSNVGTIDVPADEQAHRLFSPEWALVTVGEKDVNTALRVVVEIIVGIDGHVWKAVSRAAPSESARRAAQEAAERLEYRPRRIDGKPIQVATQVDVTVEPNPYASGNPRR